MEYIALGNVIRSAKSVRCGDCDLPILSITKADGIVLQSEKFKKRIASNETSNYKIVEKGQLVQGIHIDEANFGIQDIVFRGIVSPAYKIWDVDVTKVLPRYLEYVLRSPRSISYYASKFNGSVKRRERLSNEDFLAMSIPCPSITDQEFAVELVDRARHLMILYQQELLKLDDLVKARFVEMFGDMPRTAIISDLVAGKVSSVKKDFSPEDRIKYIDISSIDNKRNVMTGYSEYLLKDAPSRAQQHIRKGDIVISTVRPNLRNVALTEYEDNNLVASSGFCVLRAVKCLPSYLMAVVCSDEFTDEMVNVVTGANYPAIKDSDVMSYRVALPPLDLQQQFAAFVAQVDQTKASVQAALDKTQVLFDSLMQSYFG